MRFFHISKRGFILSVVIFLIVVSAAGTSFLFYLRMKELEKLAQDPQAFNRQEIKSVTEKLSSFIELPKDEEPTIATILDKEKIKDQFFDKAENGDKLLIYTRSGRAILYRPEINKVINFGTVNISTPSASNTSPVRVAVYNGTADEKMGGRLADDLQAKVKNIELAARQSAKKTDYEKTLVIDMTAGAKGDLADQMANLIKGTVAPLPEGEVAPGVSSGQIDLLIILGNDYGK